MSKHKLSDQKKRFVEAFMGPARGNATHAAKLAGYSPKTAKQQGSRLLTSVDVAREVAGYQKARARTGIADAIERDEILTKISRLPITRANNHAISVAIKELNKCSGRHSMKHVLDVGKTLADLVAGSRK